MIHPEGKKLGHKVVIDLIMYITINQTGKLQASHLTPLANLLYVMAWGSSNRTA
jgi:hypothetical protein